MHRTPWTKPASSFTSDRIKPVLVAKAQGSSKNKNSKSNVNSKDSDSEPGKSRQVRKLENLLQALQNTSGFERDPKGGCYCLARTHDLSSYTPICRACGLILCSLNQPHYCCPDCHKPLLSTTTTSSSPTRETIIAQVESQLAITISQEIEDRQRALDKARKAAGAFPALPSSIGTNSEHHHSNPVNQTHKVLSLTGSTTTKKNNRRTITVSSYTTKQPSRSGSATPNVDEEPTRLGPPNPPPISTIRPDPKRPFENFLHGSVTYKPCAA